MNSDKLHPLIFRRARVGKPLMQCQVCGAPAMYSYVSVVTCPSCKMFFKRHAESVQKPARCYFDGPCCINMNTRHACSYCRWQKCLARGMQVEMLRGRTSGIIRGNPPQQLPTLSLLRSDRSTLTMNDWTLLSNLLHCFDEYSSCPLASRYLLEQQSLPLKMRFKMGSVSALISSFLLSSQTLFEKNADFRSLDPHDRSILLRSTLKHVSGLGTAFLLNHVKLLHEPAFCQTAEAIYGIDAFRAGVRATHPLDPDNTFVKLMLATLIFSSHEYIHYTHQPATVLQDLQSVLRVQETYVELMWRYLLYKHDLRRAVSCFSNLVRSLLFVTSAIISAIEGDKYNDTMDCLLKQTEEILVITD